MVDVKPANMDDLTEVITRAAFHPTHSHQFAYSTSRGSLRLADLRAAALCDAGAKHFEDAGPGGPKNFFSEIISSISDFRFSADGRHLLARDFMTVKLWDLAMDSGPLEVHRVHESLRSRVRRERKEEGGIWAGERRKVEGVVAGPLANGAGGWLKHWNALKKGEGGNGSHSRP